MAKRRWLYFGFVVGLCLMGAVVSHAQQQPILPSLGLDGEGPNPDDVSTTLQLLFGLTVLSLLPSILVMTTSFIRISIVLGFVRRAIGTQQTPSNEIMIGLTLFLTLFIMTPVIDEIYSTAIQPYLNEEMEPLLPGEIDPFGEVVETKVPRFYVMIYKAIIPLRTFMWQQIGEGGASDVAVMMSIAGMNKPEDEHDVPTHVLIPAFMISEIKKAFMMGFMIFIPFLILDLVTASVLISMGMFQLPPAFISLPFKVLLFVLVDGWSILMRSLSISFVQNMQ